MSRARPKISVIVPAYNAQATIVAALDSLLDALAPDDEVIVVDDASTDATLHLAESHASGRIRAVAMPRNSGAGAARNLGMCLAAGDWIAMQDADDLVIPAGFTTLEDALVTATSQSKAALVYGSQIRFHEDQPDFQTAARLENVDAPQLLPGTSLLTRAAWEAAGDLREDLRAGEFIEWCARALDRGVTFHPVHTAVLWRRIRSDGTNVSAASDARHHYTRAMREILRRRRNENATTPQ